MVKKYFAGIGSRETPKWCVPIIRNITELLLLDDVHLRSGGADGADTMFENAYLDSVSVHNVTNEMEIFLPRMFFNDRQSDDVNYIYSLGDTTTRGFLEDIARQYHPRWKSLGDMAKRFMARNGQQVLGRYLDDRSTMIVCYTQLGEEVGGTGQALRIARDHNIPIFNLGIFETIFTSQDFNDIIVMNGGGLNRINTVVDNFEKFKDINESWFKEIL